MIGVKVRCELLSRAFKFYFYFANLCDRTVTGKITTGKSHSEIGFSVFRRRREWVYKWTGFVYRMIADKFVVPDAPSDCVEMIVSVADLLNIVMTKCHDERHIVIK